VQQLLSNAQVIQSQTEVLVELDSLVKT